MVAVVQDKISCFASSYFDIVLNDNGIDLWQYESEKTRSATIHVGGGIYSLCGTAWAHLHGSA